MIIKDKIYIWRCEIVVLLWTSIPLRILSRFSFWLKLCDSSFGSYACMFYFFYVCNEHVLIFFPIFLRVQITNKCLPSILKLQYLENLVLEGCFGIDDDSLAVLKQGCKSLEVPIIEEIIVCLLISFKRQLHLFDSFVSRWCCYFCHWNKFAFLKVVIWFVIHELMASSTDPRYFKLSKC